MAKHDHEGAFYRENAPAIRPEDCPHDGGQYHTRFGDVCCVICHHRVGWHPTLVRDGVFGDGTDEWTRDTLRAFLRGGDSDQLVVGLMYQHKMFSRHTV